MGQQQLMLVILGVIIVGIAIAVGILMFKANAVESSRTAIINDLGYFAMRARQFYFKPRQLGGTQHDFTGITLNMLTPLSENENGRYYIESVTPDELILVGVGKIVVHNDTIRVRMRVNEATQEVEIIN
ncbi:MAG: hypothetical protein L0287_34520 [Anaerolineae bacterium]|nr:hypothetical protein [Anaerolineae bacterium]MCI0706573.1 hypothetical protein [Ignavibacteriota bacterium]